MAEKDNDEKMAKNDQQNPNKATTARDFETDNGSRGGVIDSTQESMAVSDENFESNSRLKVADEDFDREWLQNADEQPDPETLDPGMRQLLFGKINPNLMTKNSVDKQLSRVSGIESTQQSVAINEENVESKSRLKLADEDFDREWLQFSVEQPESAETLTPSMRQLLFGKINPNLKTRNSVVGVENRVRPCRRLRRRNRSDVVSYDRIREQNTRLFWTQCFIAAMLILLSRSSVQQ